MIIFSLKPHIFFFIAFELLFFGEWKFSPHQPQATSSLFISTRNNKEYRWWKRETLSGNFNEVQLISRFWQNLFSFHLIQFSRSLNKIKLLPSIRTLWNFYAYKNERKLSYVKKYEEKHQEIGARIMRKLKN